MYITSCVVSGGHEWKYFSAFQVIAQATGVLNGYLWLNKLLKKGLINAQIFEWKKLGCKSKIASQKFVEKFQSKSSYQ